MKCFFLTCVLLKTLSGSSFAGLIGWHWEYRCVYNCVRYVFQEFPGQRCDFRHTSKISRNNVFKCTLPQIVFTWLGSCLLDFTRFNSVWLKGVPRPWSQCPGYPCTRPEGQSPKVGIGFRNCSAGEHREHLPPSDWEHRISLLGLLWQMTPNLIV